SVRHGAGRHFRLRRLTRHVSDQRALLAMSGAWTVRSCARRSDRSLERPVQAGAMTDGAERPPLEPADVRPRWCPPNLAWAGSPRSSRIPRMETITALALTPEGRPSSDFGPVVEMIASWSEPFSQRALLIGVSGCHAILLLGSESGPMSSRIVSL